MRDTIAELPVLYGKMMTTVPRETMSVAQQMTPIATRGSLPTHKNTRGGKSALRGKLASPEEAKGKSSDPGKGVEEESQWKMVQPKRKTSTKQTRPYAIVIKSSSGGSYVDILKTVKSDPQLKHVGEVITKVRKTASGDLLLQLTKPTDSHTQDIQRGVKTALGEKASVQALTSVTAIEIRDLDATTSKEELCTALEKKFDGIQFSEESLKSLRSAYSGSKTATLLLPAPIANKLLAVRKVRVGWVIGRIREKTQPVKCSKCLEFGHLAWNYKSTFDVKNACFNCGEPNLEAVECKKEAKCTICSRRNPSQVKHRTGGKEYPYYKDALKKARAP
ncbi:uncharacterized protein LOC118756584 [Rhagoletis pomonella]|uniref:uncharacterized protein LOC118756584 n=1 Tax=Rhagoletis pomonella TaxID=28610 RepID=UPI00177FE3C0|nr:uncharacterized protein LOC118756584 [Rhagoletis pomonella]